MTFDLVFRNLTFLQGKALLDAAVAAGVSLDAVAPALPFTVTKIGPPAETAPPKAVAPSTGGSPTTAPASTPAASKPAREPGADDGPPLSEKDTAFFRCPTVKSVVKMIVGDAKDPSTEAVLAACLDLRERGVAALAAVPEEQLSDRVASSLAALGF